MFQPDDVIGPYILRRQLGRGGFGEVWLAERASSLLTTQVALKLPLDAHTDLDTIRREAQVWLKASGHTNIVPVLEAEVYDGQVLIASEYVAGGSLADWLTEHGGKAPSIAEALAMIRGILAGLEHLHLNQLIHRDLKPDNVLLQTSTPRLTDFGLTLVLKTSGHTTNSVGTPGYMAPEAFQGRYSPASDVWAAGMLLHELLVGALPYPQSDFYSLLLAITSEEPIVLSDAVPDALRPVLMRALTKSASDRFASAAEMADALASAHTPGARYVSASTARPSNNLPVQTTSFIGRDREMADVKALLSKSRLLALIGSGGCGKTRLALQVVAGMLDDFADGVWFVELAPLSDPALVLQAIATVMNVTEQSGKPLTQTLVEHLKSKRLLLLLDNCEHVLDACARAADLLLKNCADVRILVSSREPLGIAGEQTYRIPSLSLPNLTEGITAESLSQCEAVRLFVDRATAARPAFAVTNVNARAVASVCHRLDGIPLAIELAAVRIRSLAVEEIDSRLDNRFRLLTGGSRTALPRQQTLLALIDWSYDLLNEQERTLLARLSIFAGGWSMEAAETVCAGEEIEECEVLDLLTALIDKSLVVSKEQDGFTRFGLLETIREYGKDKLVDTKTVEMVAMRHAVFYARIADDQGRQLRKQGDIAFPALSLEADNLRVALDWLWRTDQIQTAARMSIDLSEFWTRKGWLREGYGCLNQAAAHLDKLPDERMRAGVLKAAGWFAFLQSDFAAAETFTQQSIEASIRTAAQDIQADALNNLAMIAQAQQCLERAEALFEQSVALFRRLSDDTMLADGLMNLGFLQSTLGNHERARSHFDEARTIYERNSDVKGAAGLLCNQSDLALRQANWNAAESYAEQSLQLFRQIDDRIGIASALANRAEAAARLYHHEIVDAAVAEACAICADTNFLPLVPILLTTKARSEIARNLTADAANSLAAAHRLRALSGTPITDDERHDFARLESELRLRYADDVLDNAALGLAGVSAHDIISHLIYHA